MTIYVYVFGSFMKDGICNNLNCSLTVTHHFYWKFNTDSKFLEQTYKPGALYHKIHRLIPQDIVESSYSTDQTVNQSILKAFADSKGVHALAFCPGSLPAFRPTGIGGNSQPDDSTDALQEVADLEAPRLNIRPSNVEAVAVNSVFELHRLFSIPGAFEKVLDLIKQIQPKIVTIAEQEANHVGVAI
ncbi:hypothetical protein MTR67_045383 [Solanum verrucosum]|uniref:Uncharacterized protein n=1 Tax=Solanum verrucosum TaxID=315347 RepID=A0AAF0US61_SOLVR|nr:hypothetical protein MTR67_045383 [Solanum verrucosum]